MNSAHKIDLILSTCVALTLGTGCGSATTGATATALSVAMPAVALTSATATTATGLAFNQPQSQWTLALKNIIGLRAAIAATTTAPVQGPPSQQLTVNQAVLSQAPATGAANVNLAPGAPSNVVCFGPSLAYQTSGSGQAVNHPSGDLGMFGAVEPPTTGTTACAAAQLNYLALSMDHFNQVVKAIGVMLAAGNAAGTALPAVGATVDLTAQMPKFGTNTVSSAKFSQLSADASGNPVYKSVLAITLATGTMTITAEHMPTNATNTTFKGNIQIVMPYTDTQGTTGLSAGASMTYANDGTFLTYLASISHNRSTASSTFFTLGNVDFTKTSFGENGFLMLAKFNTTTNEGTVRYAWQAGNQDGATRAFEAQTTAASGLLSGYAYFGFGAPMSTLTPSTAEWITKFYPNWVSGLANGSTIAGGKFQGQTFAQTTAGGAFGSTGFYGPFAPTSTGLDTGGVITAGINPGGGSATTPYANTNYTVSTLNFATSGSLGTIGTVTIPTFTVQ